MVFPAQLLSAAVSPLVLLILLLCCSEAVVACPTFTRVNTTAPFYPRSGAFAFKWASQAWVVGGYDYTNSDVVSTFDLGRTWDTPPPCRPPATPSWRVPSSTPTPCISSAASTRWLLVTQRCEHAHHHLGEQQPDTGR